MKPEASRVRPNAVSYAIAALSLGLAACGGANEEGKVKAAALNTPAQASKATAAAASTPTAGDPLAETTRGPSAVTEAQAPEAAGGPLAPNALSSPNVSTASSGGNDNSGKAGPTSKALGLSSTCTVNQVKTFGNYCAAPAVGVIGNASSRTFMNTKAGYSGSITASCFLGFVSWSGATCDAAVAAAPSPAPVVVTPAPAPPSTTPSPATPIAAPPTANPVAAPAPPPAIDRGVVAAKVMAFQMEAMAANSSLIAAARTATENWGRAKTIVAESAGWTTWINQHKSRISSWFAKPRDRADLIAGYPNGLVHPTTGASIPWTMDMPEPPNGSTAEEKALKSSWAAITRQNNITFTTNAARVYQLTGDVKYAELAANQLDFYAANYTNWPLRTAIGHSRMFGQSLDEATSVLELLEAARALQGYATASRKAKWRDGLFFPIASNLQTYAWGSLNNINLWCAVATAAIGLEFNQQNWIDAGLTGPRGVSAVLSQGVTKDGIWYEGSFAYNNYVLLAMARLFDIAAMVGRGDLVNQYAPDVKRMLLSPAVYRFADGSLPSPGDTRASISPIDMPTHGALFRHVPTTYGLQYASVNRSWFTLIDPPTSNLPAATLPPIQTVYSPDIRMASIKGGDWQVFVHFGQKTVNHAQDEALTYELVHGKASITRDAGSPTSYMLDVQNDYFARGLGNNVPLVDGQGQEQWALGDVQAFDPNTGTLDVLHAKYRKDVSARRSYKLDANGFSETTRLTSSAGPRKLGVVFNTACEVQITDTRAGAATASAAPNFAAGFKYWTNVLRHQAQANWTAQLTCAGKNYELAIAASSPHTVFRATAPSTPLPATRKAIYVETTSADATFTTSIKALN